MEVRTHPPPADVYFIVFDKGKGVLVSRQENLPKETQTLMQQESRMAYGTADEALLTVLVMFR